MACTETNPFIGMDLAVLQDALTKAQAALIELSLGNKGVTFSYTQGDGTKSVTYKPTDKASLILLIAQLRKAINPDERVRRPIRVVF
jgi:hypothetical protein